MAHGGYSAGGQQLSEVLCDNTSVFCAGKAIHRWSVTGMSSVLHRRPCSCLTNYSRRVYFGLPGIYTRPSLLSRFKLSGVTDACGAAGPPTGGKLICLNTHKEH